MRRWRSPVGCTTALERLRICIAEAIQRHLTMPPLFSAGNTHTHKLPCLNLPEGHYFYTTTATAGATTSRQTRLLLSTDVLSKAANPATVHCIHTNASSSASAPAASNLALHQSASHSSPVACQVRPDALPPPLLRSSADRHPPRTPTCPQRPPRPPRHRPGRISDGLH